MQKQVGSFRAVSHNFVQLVALCCVVALRMPWVGFTLICNIAKYKGCSRHPHTPWIMKDVDQHLAIIRLNVAALNIEFVLSFKTQGCKMCNICKVCQVRSLRYARAWEMCRKWKICKYFNFAAASYGANITASSLCLYIITACIYALYLFWFPYIKNV